MQEPVRDGRYLGGEHSTLVRPQDALAVSASTTSMHPARTAFTASKITEGLSAPCPLGDHGNVVTRPPLAKLLHRRSTIRRAAGSVSPKSNDVTTVVRTFPESPPGRCVQ